eukprot:scaffold20632_cov63-Phaeocystis_antarctica.AAC.7
MGALFEVCKRTRSRWHSCDSTPSPGGRSHAIAQRPRSFAKPPHPTAQAEWVSRWNWVGLWCPCFPRGAVCNYCPCDLKIGARTERPGCVSERHIGRSDGPIAGGLQILLAHSFYAFAALASTHASPPCSEWGARVLGRRSADGAGSRSLTQADPPGAVPPGAWRELPPALSSRRRQSARVSRIGGRLVLCPCSGAVIGCASHEHPPAAPQ